MSPLSVRRSGERERADWRAKMAREDAVRGWGERRVDMGIYGNGE